MIVKEAEVVYRTHRIDGKRPRVVEPRHVFDLLRDRALAATREVFWVLYLNGRNGLLAIETVAVGTLTQCEVHPREVFRGAIIAGAASIILSHNHPSGNSEPGPEDAAITRRLSAVGELLGIKVLDHVIIGDDGYVSITEREGVNALL